MLGGVVKVMVASYLIAVFFVLAVAFAQEDRLLERLDGEWLTAVIIAVLYLVVMLFSRWNFTAVPKRNSIKAQIEAIRKRLESEEVEAQTAKIEPKLVTATAQSKRHCSLKLTRNSSSIS
jgi:type VI protein secretion system component VasK